ncbi:unnamed protein product, partial [Meganyctiphanes norvegica]
MLQAFDVTAQTCLGLSLGNHKLSVQDGRRHLHAIQVKSHSQSGPTSIQFTDENGPPSTDGILTFMDFAWPNQKPRRVYMKMIGNTLRARQHLLLVTGQCGYSYRDLRFLLPYNPGQPGESITIRPYDGENATPLFKDVTKTDKVSHDLTAGLILGAQWGGDSTGNNMLFGFMLKDEP